MTNVWILGTVRWLNDPEENRHEIMGVFDSPGAAFKALADAAITVHWKPIPVFTQNLMGKDVTGQRWTLTGWELNKWEGLE